MTAIPITLTRGPFTAVVATGDMVPMTDGTSRLVVETDHRSLTLPVAVEGLGWYDFGGLSYKRHSKGAFTIAQREACPDIAVIKLAKEQKGHKGYGPAKPNRRMKFTKSKSLG